MGPWKREREVGKGTPRQPKGLGNVHPQIPQPIENKKLWDWKAVLGRTEVKLPTPGNTV